MVRMKRIDIFNDAIYYQEEECECASLALLSCTIIKKPRYILLKFLISTIAKGSLCGFDAGTTVHPFIWITERREKLHLKTMIWNTG
jgi:hypothetical protein